MKKTPPILIFLAFIVVALPLGWGLYRSIKNSMPLFTGGTAAAPAATATPAAAPAAPSK
jgi:hypothetical protein